MQLQGKTVLITGGRRVGAVLARELASRGAHVAMSYFHSRDRIEQILDEVRSYGVRGLAVRADLRDPQQAEHLVQQIATELAGLHVLVNMASTFEATPFDRLQPDDLEQNLASNLKTVYYTSVAAARVMRQQPLDNGLQGKIVSFSDWAVDRPYRHHLPYMIAKGAVNAMTLALAAELAPTITVNAVAPAMIDPPPDLTAAEIESIRHASPLQRIGRPEDATRLVLYLLEGSDFVTGAIYRVDGGRFLGVDGKE